MVSQKRESTQVTQEEQAQNIRDAAASMGVSEEALLRELRALETNTLNVRTCRIATALGITNK